MSRLIIYSDTWKCVWDSVSHIPAVSPQDLDFDNY